MLNLLDGADRTTLVIENVPFMLYLREGQAVRYLVHRVEGLGYRRAYRILDTTGFGLRQQRRRVYFVASEFVDTFAVPFRRSSTLEERPAVSTDQPIGLH